MIVIILVAKRIRKNIVEKTYEEFREKDDSYSFIVENLNGTNKVSKIIINTGTATKDFSSDDLAPQNFSLDFFTEEKPEEKKKITPVKIYFSDIDGNEVEKDEETSHITMELASEGEESVNFTENTRASVSHPKLPQSITTFDSALLPE